MFYCYIAPQTWRTDTMSLRQPTTFAQKKALRQYHFQYPALRQKAVQALLAERVQRMISQSV